MFEQNTTGYPSIDRPWLKFYRKEFVETPMTELSVYEYLRDSNRDNGKNTALVYMGRKISYQVLFDSIESVAKAFRRLGLSRGDVVACIAPSFPEVIYSFYAANKLGAISNYFDPRTEPQIIYDELEQVKPKLFLIFDDFLPKFQAMIDKLNIPNAIVVSAKDSLPFPARTLVSLKKKPIPQRYVPFAQVLDKSKDDAPVKTVTNIPHEIALMEHTGGTTGIPKAVCLTNQNVNSVHFQIKRGGYDTAGNHTYSTIAFPFTAYGLIGSLHDPLIDGMACHLNFSFEMKDIARSLIKHRLGNISNTPLFWESMMRLYNKANIDLSFVKNAIVGTDTLDKEKEKEINAFLAEHNNPIRLKKGYGMTEVASAVAVTFSNDCNKIGSVGIPFTHTTIAIFDTETGEELKYGEQGEICISGPNVMKGYYNNPEETAKVLKVHKDGNVWMHSGDIGHMDEDGFLFVDGRIKRMIINHHSFKIFAPEIEKTLSKHAGVEKCCVVGAPDTEYKTGQIAVAFIIQKPDCTVAEEELRELCNQELPEYYMPGRFIFTEQFPYTSAAKVDYRELEAMAGSM